MTIRERNSCYTIFYVTIIIYKINHSIPYWLSFFFCQQNQVYLKLNSINFPTIEYRIDINHSWWRELYALGTHSSAFELVAFEIYLNNETKNNVLHVQIDRNGLKNMLPWCNLLQIPFFVFEEYTYILFQRFALCM